MATCHLYQNLHEMEEIRKIYKDKKDPHYGWTLGDFFVNGYTRDMKDENGDFIFLKNVGDKVELHFQLLQQPTLSFSHHHHHLFV